MGLPAETSPESKIPKDSNAARQSRDARSLRWFLILAFGPAWLFFVLPLAFGPIGSPGWGVAVAPAWTIAMWAPGIAAILTTRYVMGESLGSLNLRRLGPKRYYLWAWLLPPALAIVAGLLTLVLGAGRLDLGFTAMREALAAAPGGEAIPVAVVVATQVALAFTLAPLVNTLVALGEELGWRGFLLPHLATAGEGRAILVSGVIWGIWHAPVILQGHNYPGQPVLGIFMMVVFCVLGGAILGWLYFATRSPWAPALAHGSLNATAGLPVLFVADVDIVLGGTLASAIGWIGLAAFVGWLVATRRLLAPSKPSS